jgi:hypothetical protein
VLKHDLAIGLVVFVGRCDVVPFDVTLLLPEPRDIDPHQGQARLGRLIIQPRLGASVYSRCNLSRAALTETIAAPGLMLHRAPM